MPRCGGIPGSSNRETENLLLEGLDIQCAKEKPRDPAGGAGEEVAREKGDMLYPAGTVTIDGGVAGVHVSTQTKVTPSILKLIMLLSFKKCHP